MGIFHRAIFSQNHDLLYFGKVLWVLFSRKRIFENSFIGIHQARSKLAIVYTRDARNGDPCQVVQYYGYGHTRLRHAD